MKIVLTGMIITACSGMLHAGQLSVEYTHWQWKETDAQGESFLEESGPVLGAVLRFEKPVASQWKGDVSIRGWVGEVDYDGATQLGQPVESTTEYQGADVWLGVYREVKLDRAWTLHAVGGLGLSTWRRDLDNTARYDGGYRETWFEWLGTAGVEVEYEPAEDVAVVVGLGVEMPLYTEVEYSLSLGQQGSISVEPGKKPGFLFRLEVHRERFFTGASWSYREYGRSEAADAGAYQVFQPASERMTGSLFIGASF